MAYREQEITVGKLLTATATVAVSLATMNTPYWPVGLYFVTIFVCGICVRANALAGIGASFGIGVAGMVFMVFIAIADGFHRSSTVDADYFWEVASDFLVLISFGVGCGAIIGALFCKCWNVAALCILVVAIWPLIAYGCFS
jgi:hypothetical protein